MFLLNKTISAVSLFVCMPIAMAANDKTSESLKLTGDAVNTGSITQMLFGLLVIVGLILGMAWVMRRLGQFQGSSNANMKVLASLSLGQRERALLIQVGDTQLLVGTAPGNVRTLHVFDEPVALQTEQGEPGFAERLRVAINANVKKE